MQSVDGPRPRWKVTDLGLRTRFQVLPMDASELLKGVKTAFKALWDEDRFGQTVSVETMTLPVKERERLMNLRYVKGGWLAGADAMLLLVVICWQRWGLALNHINAERMPETGFRGVDLTRTITALACDESPCRSTG